jgi:hypothetical protein
LGLQQSWLGHGKSLGNYVWLHKSALWASGYANKHLILDLMNDDYSVVRLHKHDSDFQLSKCPLFNIQREPFILGHRTYSSSGDLIKEINPATKNHLIFHHKHLFVHHKHYQGFDVEAAQQWSLTWKAILPSCRSVSSRIGRINGWNEQLKTYALPINQK